MKKVLLASVFAAVSAVSSHAADFGGAYVGADVDYSKSSLSVEDASGISGGLNAGYGVELGGKWYLGGEIGGGISGVEGETAKGSIEKSYSYGASARLGYKVTDGILAYGIVGLEGGEFEHAGAKDRDWGVKYGLGAEAFVRENVTVRGEVDYVDWQGDNGLPGKGEWRSSLGVAYHF
jgi:outer membrane immunogenic protein